MRPKEAIEAWIVTPQEFMEEEVGNTTFGLLA